MPSFLQSQYYICKFNKNEFLVNSSNSNEDKNKNKIISPWHDINISNNLTNTTTNSTNSNYDSLLKILYKEPIVNIVIEIPKHSSAKMEMSKDLEFNPIIQDYKYDINNHPYNRYIKVSYDINYGMIPQTWENNQRKILNNMIGDNDPLDCIDISNKVFYIGDVIETEVLGSFCLIDQGEIDFKVIVISKDYLQSVNKLGYEVYDEYIASGKMKQLMDKFKYYKLYEGKNQNEIYNNKLFSKEETIDIIYKSHIDYREYIKK